MDAINNKISVEDEDFSSGDSVIKDSRSFGDINSQ